MCRCDGSDCQCRRVNAVNPFSGDYRAGVLSGRKAEADRTTNALTELRDKGLITQIQYEMVLDLILEKLTESMDID